MPFGAHVLSALEDALSESFGFHKARDSFLSRSGVDPSALAAARTRADARGRASVRQWDKAPKRFVVQEVLSHLGASGKVGDIVIANLVTAVCKGQFPDATPKGIEAVAILRQHQDE